jgi:hypothetical protein
MQLGHDQLLLMNRTNAGGGRIMIADFSTGQLQAKVHYWENWDQHPRFDGWQDDSDRAYTGDFMQLGTTMLLSANLAV